MKPVPFPTPEEIDKIKLFFIIGRPRSGTTLLRTLLDAHPNVIVPTECPFILQLAKRYRNINCLNKNIIDRFVTDLAKVWLFKITQIEIEQLKYNLKNYTGKIDYLILCKIVILHFPAIFPKEQIILVGDKNPSNSTRFNKLFKIFGLQCKYIFIHRDFRDQFNSQRKLNIEIPSISTSAKRWKFVQNIFKKYNAKYENNFLSVKYENLAMEPETEVKRVSTFLNIPYNNEVLSFHKHKDEFEKLFTSKGIERTHKSLLNPINTGRSGIWKTELSDIEKNISVLVCGKQLQESGYEVSKVSNPLITRIRILPGIIGYYFSQLLIALSYLLPLNLFLKVSKGSALGYILKRIKGRHK